MNQQTKFTSSEFKGIVINLFLSLLAFLLFLLLGSFVLIRIHHFERFYSPLVYLSLFFLSLVISLLSKRLQGSLMLHSMITALVISIVHLSVNLIFSLSEFRFNQLIPTAFFLASTFFISVFLGKSKGSRRKHKNFSYKR